MLAAGRHRQVHGAAVGQALVADEHLLIEKAQLVRARLRRCEREPPAHELLLATDGIGVGAAVGGGANQRFPGVVAWWRMVAHLPLPRRVAELDAAVRAADHDAGLDQFHRLQQQLLGALNLRALRHLGADVARGTAIAEKPAIGVETWLAAHRDEHRAVRGIALADAVAGKLSRAPEGTVAIPALALRRTRWQTIPGSSSACRSRGWRASRCNLLLDLSETQVSTPSASVSHNQSLPAAPAWRVRSSRIRSR